MSLVEDTSNSSQPTNKPRRRINLFHILLLVWAFILVRDFSQYNQNVESLPYSQFMSLLSQKKIESVLVGQEKVEGTLKDVPSGRPKRFTTVKIDDPDLIRKLTEANVRFSGVRESWIVRGLFSWLLPIIFMLGLWGFMANRLGKSSGSPFLSLGKSKARIYVEKDLKTRLSDVAGIDEVKAELEEVVSFLKDPKKHSRLGGRMPKGLLLIGAPGTGKTMLARAVAGEAGVPFFSINGSEFVELFVGLGAARVRDLFQQARAQAPCIVFIDELDALGKARGLSAIAGSASDEKEQTLNQLLAEMDGFDSSQGIVIIGATNRPEVLDPALSRAGRFDRQILVDKPDRKGRQAILLVHLRGVQISQEVSVEMIASMTTGFSGADLANLVNEAALIATRRGAKAVEPRDFTEAVERVVAGLERKSRLLSQDEKVRVAYHEMGHAVLALAFGETETVHKVTIVPRGIAALGYTFRRPTEDRYLMNRNELEKKIAVLLGGRAAETIFFEDISTGAADDLDKATEIARAMVTRYGMSEFLGPVTFERESTPLLGGHLPVKSADYSESTAKTIDGEVKRLLGQSLEVARVTLTQYRDIVEEGAKNLIDLETLDEQHLKRLWERRNRRKTDSLERSLTA